VAAIIRYHEQVAIISSRLPRRDVGVEWTDDLGPRESSVDQVSYSPRAIDADCGVRVQTDERRARFATDVLRLYQSRIDEGPFRRFRSGPRRAARAGEENYSVESKATTHRAMVARARVAKKRTFPMFDMGRQRSLVRGEPVFLKGGVSARGAGDITGV
jgi:hypothetical protein